MAWNMTSDLLVGGTGQVYTGATTATAPTNATTAPTAGEWSGLGYHSDDGVSLTVTPNIQEFPVWQSKQPARRTSLATEILTSFSLAQWDEDTVPLAFGGGTIVRAAASIEYQFPSDTASLTDSALIVDVQDPDNSNRSFRFYWKRGNVTEAVTAAFNRSNLALLPIGFKALAPTGGGSPGSFFTDSPAFAAGSVS